MGHGNKQRTMLKQTLALLLGGLLSNSAVADFLPGFAIQELQGLGFSLDEVYDINNLGFAAGSSVGGGAFEAEARPVFWDEAGNVTQLEFSSNPSSTRQKISDINDIGNMIGSHEVLGAAVWIDLIPTSLESATGGAIGGGAGADINNANQIAGSTYFSNFGRRATIWNDLKPSLLGGEPEGYTSGANSINNLGQVIGTFRQAYVVPVTWLDNQTTYLGSLPGFEPNAIPFSINDSGQVVGLSGTSSNTSPNQSRAVIWENGLIADLGTLGGDTAGAFGINNVGQIIGASQDAAGKNRPFLWQEGVMYDLTPALCADPASCRVSVTAINDHNQIVFTETVDSPFSSVAYTYAYKLTVAEGVLSALPSVSAPLNFVTPDGAGPVGDTPPVIGNADLQISMTTDQATITKGGQLQYDIVVTNNGPTQARDVVLTDEIPNNVRLLARSDFKNCSFSYPVICNYTLDAGASVTVTLTVEHLKGKKITNTATVESATFDPDLRNNSATEENWVVRGRTK